MNTKKITFLSKIILLGDIISYVILITFRGKLSVWNYSRNPFYIKLVNAIASAIISSIIACLLGIIPYFLFYKKINNSKITIFGTLFIIINILIIMLNNIYPVSHALPFPPPTS